MTDKENNLIEVEGLSVSYSRGLGRKPFRAVSDVSFALKRGETLSIVGESGSGKTTIGSAILGLAPVTQGRIRLKGQEIAHLGRSGRKGLRSTLQAIFQDPFSSLDPTKTIAESVGEPLRADNPRLTRGDVESTVAAVLARVGFEPMVMQKFPGEFSGGQRQRLSIARALILKPEVVVCDEAVSALDVSVQAQVLNLLDTLQRDDGMSYIFISHNMAVVRHISDRVVVLYRGRVMEIGKGEDVCDRPLHPYTRSLIAAVPVPNVVAQRERRLKRAASASAASGLSASGCPFAPRCPYAKQICVDRVPELTDAGAGRQVACVRIDEIGASDNRASQFVTV